MGSVLVKTLGLNDVDVKIEEKRYVFGDGDFKWHGYAEKR